MLTVLQVAYPFAAVGPDAVGGAEQVMHHLDDALVNAGHRSIAIAAEGSKVAGELVATPAQPGTLDENAKRAAQSRHRQTIAHVLERESIDVVHFHGIDFASYLTGERSSILGTLHLPPDWYEPDLFRSGIRLNCVSQAQRRACPAQSADIPVIGNGVAVDLFTPRRKRRFALCLARVCPEKGLHLAIEAARRAAIPLALGGQIFPYPAHEAYFRREIAPALDRRRRFLGPLGGRRKRRLLAAARCLVIPSQVAETSSLAAMEALASGTPVVAFRRGALPEIVEHGRTGFLVESVAEMAAAIEACGDLDPSSCREAARARFSVERMTEDYLRLYRDIVRTEASRHPRASGGPEENGFPLSRE